MEESQLLCRLCQMQSDLPFLTRCSCIFPTIGSSGRFTKNRIIWPLVWQILLFSSRFAIPVRRPSTSSHIPISPESAVSSGVKLFICIKGDHAFAWSMAKFWQQQIKLNQEKNIFAPIFWHFHGMVTAACIYYWSVHTHNILFPPGKGAADIFFSSFSRSYTVIWFFSSSVTFFLSSKGHI